MELWKRINKNYLVSSQGRVMNKHGKILKPYRSSTGYLKICLENHKQVYVHRLVANAFCENNGNSVVDHINGNKMDNRAENLEWVSLKENTIRMVKLGLNSSKGKMIIAKNENSEHLFKSIKSAARIFGINPSCIRSALANGYKTRGYHWALA